jgi:5-methyltetrahydropteroyltriglutamate--homocysteine methyltransferase
MLKSTVIGNYPKLPTQKGDINIRRMLHRFDKAEIDRQELELAFDSVTARVLREQFESGIDLPTDGQIRWDDIVTPFASQADGFEINGLIRWFDNNVYYRKPTVVGEIKWRKPVAANAYQLAFTQTGKPVKAVLPAPYSFMKLSEDCHYHNQDRLIADLSALLRAEVEALVTAGAEHIQFDDPCLQYHPEDLPLAAEALNSVIKGLRATFWLCFYFGSIEKIAPDFEKFKVGVIAADCVSIPANCEQLLRFAHQHTPCFGLVDARNIKLEQNEHLVQKYKQISAQFPDAYIGTSCGLEFLPHASALEKIRLLGRTVKHFRGE